MQQLYQTVQTFITFLTPVVCIAIVYFLGRIKPIGRFYAMLLIPPGKIMYALSQFLSPFDVEQRKNESKHPGLRTIVLMFALTFALVATGSDGFLTLQALSALWPDASLTLPPLPSWLSYSFGWLFLSLPSLTGCIWLENKKAVHSEAQIFIVPEEHQKKFARFISLTFLLSVVTTIVFNTLKPAYLIDSSSWYTEVLQVCVFVLLGGLLPLIMAITLYILALGVQAIMSLILTLVWFLATLLCDLIDNLVVDFSRYEKSIKDRHQGERVYDRTATVTINPVQTPPSLPQRASVVVDADIVQPEAQPIDTQELENTKIMNPDKNAFLCFKGVFGSQMFPHVGNVIQRRDATASFLASYFLDRTRTNVNTTIDGIRDLSHSIAEWNVSMLHGESEDQGDHTLLCDLTHKVASVYQHLIAVTAPFIYFIGIDDVLPAIDLIEANKRRSSLISQVVITSVSKHDLERKSALTAMGDLVALQRERIIDNIVTIDQQHSKLRSIYGEDTVLRFLASWVVDLITAHKHHLLNLSFASVFKQVGLLSPVSTVSFASESVVVGDLPKRWKFANLLPGIKGQAGTGSYADVLSQTRKSIDRAVNAEDASCFPVKVPTDTMCVILNTAPFDFGDLRFNNAVRDNSMYVSRCYPFAKSITCKGNGVPYYPTLGGSRLQVTSSCLYPVHTANLLRLPDGKSTKVTTLYSVSSLEPASSNGTGSAQETKPEVMPTKPVAKATHKKAAPTRRVARKTKQAQ